MTEPFKLKCAGCEFETLDPSDMVAHMMSCEDAMDPELKAQLADSSLFAELTEMLRGIQENPELGEPVDPDEMPEEARRRLDAAVEREKNRKE